MERFVFSGHGRISAAHAHDALFVAFIRNARSAMVCGRYGVAREILRKALRVSGTLSEWRQTGALCLLMARVALVRRVRG